MDPTIELAVDIACYVDYVEPIPCCKARILICYTSMPEMCSNSHYFLCCIRLLGLGRSGAELGSYAAGFMPGLVGQYPKTLIYMRAAAAAADAAASESSIWNLVSSLKAVPWCVISHDEDIHNI